MTNKSPYFSVIIPTLNEAEYLPHLLEDLTRQTFRDFEVIVVDANSQDFTLNTATPYQKLLPSLSLLTSQIKQVSAQRNLGAHHSLGKMLLFMDADNRLPKFYLEGLAYRLHSTHASLFTTWLEADSTDIGNKTIATFMNLQLEGGVMANTPFAFGAMIGCEKQVFQNTTGFDSNLTFGEDTYFVRQLHKNHPFHIFQDPRYIVSFRRFKKNGTLKTLQSYAYIQLKMLMSGKIDPEKDYPMGGSVLKKDDSGRLMAAFRDNIKKIKHNPKLIKIYQAIITLAES